MAWDLDEVHRWNDRHAFAISEDALALFSSYLETRRYVIFQSLVEHPASPEDVQKYAACSTTFQRGDIVFDPATRREDLFLQSQFHDTGPGGAAVNFAPTQALHLSFTTNPGIWYPLRVTKLNSEPTSVVLNVCTPHPIKETAIPEGFEIARRGRAMYGVHHYYVTQFTAIFDAGVEVPDFELTWK